jgi:uncharacterized membrane protein YkoI
MEVQRDRGASGGKSQNRHLLLLGGFILIWRMHLTGIYRSSRCGIGTKIKRLISSGLVVLLVAGCASEKGEAKADQARLQAEAKISRAEAEKIALTQAPDGTIKEGELEKEKGKLIWSFDIARPGEKDITEVGVDAITGKVVSVEKETAAQEAKEKTK